MFEERILRPMMAWAHLGMVDDGDGMRLIGQIKHLGPLAYMHTTFRPVSSKQCVEYGRNYDISIPRPIMEFLEISNGLRMFSNDISVSGVRQSYDRSDNVMLRMPYDLADPNRLERPAALPENHYIFAFYAWDGSRGVMRPDGSVYRATRGLGDTSLGCWDTFDHWLLSEFERVKAFFDLNGRPLADDAVIYGFQ
ncbi:hypothetical protein [Emcibacter sp. SYSU 3D8]|uniref:hypothetical protein n=1 Tax=Emcibacter sp. SYSU 3D8 TaxID=3133969 RepID=UPI0031FE6FBC